MKNSPSKRSFVPSEIDFLEWHPIEELYCKLESVELESAAQLEQWLFNTSELAACLREAYAQSRIDMTCDTENADKERRFLTMIEDIIPKCAPWDHKLTEKYISCPARTELNMQRYGVMDRSSQVALEIYREENIPLQVETSKLGQQYQKICGGLTVDFDGAERTLPQMTKYLEENDRDLRERAWRGMARVRLEHKASLNDIFDQLVQFRNTMARNAACESFVDLAFKSMRRFDYTPTDCIEFHATVRDVVVPIHRSLMSDRCQKLKLENLRPWDMQVDPEGRAPLRPFRNGTELIAGTQCISDRINTKLGKFFSWMQEIRALDLESRKGKAPGGYMSQRDETRRPFIFMNAAGLQRDVNTLLHETGHAYHSYLCKDDPIYMYRSPPIEFAEVASMSMELLAFPYYDEFYSEQEANRARRSHLEDLFALFTWVAQIDAFQHWIYTNPRHSVAEREAYWLELDQDFGASLDWSGLDEERASQWQRQLHLYTAPLYYIEYAIAQLGALQVWRNSIEDPERAFEQYSAGLALGGSRPLPELFTTAGIQFDFSRNALEPLMEFVQQQIELF